MTLELTGNAWPDLAGCLLTFTNPQKRIRHSHLDSLHSLQLFEIREGILRLMDEFRGRAL